VSKQLIEVARLDHPAAFEDRKTLGNLTCKSEVVRYE
jgi:hypothetical protein